MDGYPVQIVAPRKDHNLQIDAEYVLKKILYSEDIKDRDLVVISIAGAFRKGKSFLLNFLLRYLEATYGSNNSGSTAWLGDDDVELEGFSWKGGTNRDTTGILMWSKIFKADLPTGEKVAIVLLDTQGMFDVMTTTKECISMFALSTLLSSVQIYNLSQNIQEDDLQNLQLFVEYGRTALTDDKHKPFQNLMFLIRDWCGADYGYSYGIGGGGRFISEKLSITEVEDPSMQRLRNYIKTCFSDISCFLLPHPGLYVAHNSNFKGKLKDINDDFKMQLLDLVPLLLAPNNLVIKKVQGKSVKTFELLDLLKKYVTILNISCHQSPSAFQTLVESSNEAAIHESLKFYGDKMRDFVQDELLSLNRLFDMLGQLFTATTYQSLDSDKILDMHNKVRTQTLLLFDRKTKVGGAELARPFRVQLENKIESIFAKLIKCNEGKSYGERLVDMISLLTALISSSTSGR